MGIRPPDDVEPGSEWTAKPAVNSLAWVKLVMLAFGCVFGLFLGIRDLSIALTEDSPSVFAIETFPEQYQGEHWLELHGRLAVAQRSVRPSGRQVHADDPERWFVSVPVVSEPWESPLPVHVLADYGPFTADEMSAWLLKAPLIREVRGQTRRGAPIDGAFPRHGTPFVTINVGTEPNLTTALVFSAMMLVFGLTAGWVLVDEVRGRVRQRSASRIK